MLLLQFDDQDAAAFKQVFGESAGERASLIANELLAANYEWAIYRTLFGTCEERVVLLNDAMTPFAAVFQETLFDSVLMRIARLTDRCGAKAQDNVSFCALKMDLIESEDNCVCIEGIESKLSCVTEKVKEIHLVRNKRISHNDYEMALADYEDLPGFSRKTISSVLEQMSIAFNVVREQAGLPALAFDLMYDQINKPFFFDVLSAGLRSLNKTAR